jgi:hypothetical protein
MEGDDSENHRQGEGDVFQEVYRLNLHVLLQL